MATIWWQQLVLVMCGGALGSAARFWLGGALLRRLGEGIPWGTLAANLLGSFAIGFLAVWLEGRGPQALSVRLRLERAAQLLRTTSMMIGEVAAATGFDNCCSFARAFKNHHGVPASRYRSAARRNAANKSTAPA